MDNVLVQVLERYLCITACSPLSSDNDKEKNIDTKTAYSFSSPILVPIEKEMLKERSSVWEDPELMAKLVKDGLSQMSHSEIKNVILVLESFDLTCQEYQHINGSSKALKSLAIDKIKDFVGEDISNYSVIYSDYIETKNKVVSGEITTKAFAVPKLLIDDLVNAFKANQLNLIKVIPAECAMIYSAKNTVYSFEKTVALVSMDFSAVRVVICQNGKLLYSHDFHSPADEILKVIEEDRNISTSAAFDYLRTAGYGFKNDCRTSTAQRKLEEISETLIDEIVRNIRIVTMSLNLELEQMFLSDFFAYIPHIRNFFVKFGLSKDIILISDTFRPSSIIPEPSLKARDDFYKSGSFFIFNELMNSGSVFEDNLIYGLKAAAAKNIYTGQKITSVGCAVLGALLVIGIGTFAFFEIRSAMDNSAVNNPKYDPAKTLIEKQNNINNALQNQQEDAKLLPRTQLYCEDVVNELNTQVVSKITYFDYYSITHSRDEATGLETYSMPISGKINNFNTFISLQNNIKEDGFFVMSPVFSVSENSGGSGFLFSTQLTADQNAVSQQQDTQTETETKSEDKQ